VRNRQIAMTTRPIGVPKVEDFSMVTEDVPQLGDQMVLVGAQYLSVDPYMRGRMRDRPSYAPPFALNTVVPAAGVGVVRQSKHPDFSEGDVVLGPLGWQELALIEGAHLQRIDPALAPISTALGVLGMPGLTAYFGMTHVAEVQQGQTVVVSAAAGAVGLVACQVGKILGARVIGIAGSEVKTQALVNEFGADGAINYRTDDVNDSLARLCPAGVDVYFDNVGGVITDILFEHLSVHARVAVCGQISGYNLETTRQMPDMLWRLVSHRIRVEGFLVGDFADQRQEALLRLSHWYQDGKLISREHIVDGLERLPEAFLGLFSGENLGKQLVRV